MPLPALLLALATPADAAEFQIEGFYRARARAFDTRSLTRDNAAAEGATAFVQHRLWLRPRIVLSDKVSLHMEFRGFDNVLWGQNPQVYDPFLSNVPDVFDYGLDAPGADADRPLPLDFSLWRAWGEVHTSVGRFTVGRVPLHWGLGIWLNDGVSTNPAFSDFGDTTDRVMWEYLANEQVYVRAAVDVPVEGLLGADDDTTVVSGAVAYRTEDVTLGLLAQYDRVGGDRAENAEPFNMFTIDLAGEASLGGLHAAVEAVGHFGDGGLVEPNGTAFPNQSVRAFGVAAEASLELEPFTAEIRGGFASGDNDIDLTDNSRRTYAFDRDYSIGMFLFEQPLPVFTAGSDLNETDVRTGPRIANAIFVAPTIRRELLDGLHAHVTYATARTASGEADVVTDLQGPSSNGGYGHEIQVGAQYLGTRPRRTGCTSSGVRARPGLQPRVQPADGQRGWSLRSNGVRLPAERPHPLLSAVYLIRIVTG